MRTLVFETELPDEVEAAGLRDDEVRLLERCCTAKGVLFQGDALRRGGKVAMGTRGRGWPLPGRPDAQARIRPVAERRKVETGTVVFVRPVEAFAGANDGPRVLHALLAAVRGAGMVG